MDRTEQLLVSLGREQEAQIEALSRRPMSEAFLDDWASTPGDSQAFQERERTPSLPVAPLLAAAAVVLLVGFGVWKGVGNPAGASSVQAERFPTQSSASQGPVAERSTPAILSDKKMRGEQNARTGDAPLAPAIVVPKASPTPKSLPSAWRALAKKGDHAAAYRAASDLGWDNLAAQAGAEDLFALAEVSRFAVQPQRAQWFLLELRERFPADSRAALAAFYLGRMAAADPSQKLQAMTWFRTYLREQPGGSLARDASGRLLEMESDGVSRKERARDYLVSFPRGPHAALAQKILGDE